MSSSLQSDSTDSSRRPALLQGVIYVSTLIGGATGIAAMLLAFGFFSQSALYGFAGLPMLTVDYTGLVEVGANGLVKSLTVLFESPVRLGAIFTLLAGSVAFWLFYDRVETLRNLARRPVACLWAHALIVLLLFSALTGLTRIARLADTKERSVSSGEVIDDVTRERQRDSWTPLAEDQIIMRHTYPTVGLYWLVGKFSFQDRKPEDFLKFQSERSTTTGYPLRRSITDRQNSRTLYGWALFSVLTLALLLAFGVRWLAWLDVERAKVRQGESLPGLRPFEAMQVTRWLLQPIAVVCALVAISLLPIAYGILVSSVIGEEKVVVQLNHSQQCVSAVQFVDASKPVDSESRQFGLEEPNKMADILAKLDSLQKNKGEHKSLDPLRMCDSLKVAELEHKEDAIHVAMRDLVQNARESNLYDDSTKKYSIAIDDLVKWIEENGCLQGLQNFSHLKPSSNLFLRFPAAAEHYLARWTDLQRRFGRSKSGYILRYPRGSEIALTIFEPLIAPTPLVSARWLVQVIPTECIEDIKVEPDPVAQDLDRFLAQYDGTLDTQNALNNRLKRIHPKVVASMLTLMSPKEVRVSTPHFGMMMTSLGTITAALRDSEPEATMLASEALQRIVISEDAQPDVRGSAATAFHLIGGVYAARQFSRSLPPDLDPTKISDTVLGPSITAAGYLLADLSRWHSDLGYVEEPPHSPELQEVHARLLKWLEQIVDQPGRFSSEMRGAAASALGKTHREEETTRLLAMLDEAQKQRNFMLVGPTITALAFLQSPRSIEPLWGVAADPQMPPALRGGALMAIYGIGMFDQTDRVFDLIFNPEVPSTVRSFALDYLNDLNYDVAARKAVDCAKDSNRLEWTRASCAVALMSLAEIQDGDGGSAEDLRTLILDSSSAESIRAAACFSLTQYELRGGHVARNILGDGSVPCDLQREQLRTINPQLRSQFVRYRIMYTFFRIDPRTVFTQLQSYGSSEHAEQVFRWLQMLPEPIMSTQMY